MSIPPLNANSQSSAANTQPSAPSYINAPKIDATRLFKNTHSLDKACSLMAVKWDHGRLIRHILYITDSNDVSRPYQSIYHRDAEQSNPLPQQKES